MTDTPMPREEYLDQHIADDIPSNTSDNPVFTDIAAASLDRRDFMQAAGVIAGAAGIVATPGIVAADSHGKSGPSTLSFKSLKQEITPSHAVAEGYEADILIRWGDQVEQDAPAWTPNQIDAAAQSKQFGYNNDYVGYQPLPVGSNNSEHGLLCVSHEYTNAHLMFSGVDKKTAKETLTREQAMHEMAAHGHSIIEIKKEAGKWGVVENSEYARRITALATEIDITGPAAGHDRLKTSYDPTGTKVIGTLNNCAGGTTPWGTILIAEENFNGYFGGDPKGTPEERNYGRLGMKGKSWYSWSKYVDRLDVSKELNEANRFGWMVEIDPYDPASTPKKRTALGRFKHEGASVIINKDNKVVAYSGDDQRFDYVYKFVSEGSYNPDNRAANMDLLENGTLYVGKFKEDGKLIWMPILFGEGPLTAKNGFNSQADVLIETRLAADLLGATKMDRPEDVEPNPVNGSVYMMLTNNTRRKEATNAANPRLNNRFGHIIEMTPPGGKGMDADHTATEFTWDFVLLAGNPADPEHGAVYHPQADSWLAAPDNLAIDPKGRLWISTDQGGSQARNNIPDGMHATDLEGPGRALTKFFFACPVGAEMCGPEFTPDGKNSVCRGPASGRYQRVNL